MKKFDKQRSLRFTQRLCDKINQIAIQLDLKESDAIRLAIEYTFKNLETIKKDFYK